MKPHSSKPEEKSYDYIECGECNKRFEEKEFEDFEKHIIECQIEKPEEIKKDGRPNWCTCNEKYIYGVHTAHCLYRKRDSEDLINRCNINHDHSEDYKECSSKPEEKWEIEFGRKFGIFEEYKKIIEKNTIPTKESLDLIDAQLRLYEELVAFIRKTLSSTLERAIERVKKMRNGVAFQLKAEMISMRILKQEFNWDESQNDAHIRIAREISKFYQAELDDVIKVLKESV